MTKINIKSMFDKPKIIGIIADVNSGKSNTIYHLIDELKQFKAKIYTYGLRSNIKSVTPIYSVHELESITDSIVFVDEMMTLFNLDDRKIKRQIENTLRLINHNNNILVLSGIGENWKKFISSKLDMMILKKVTISDLINGNYVKRIIIGYRGTERGETLLNLKIEEAIWFDGLHYHKINIPYMKEYDSKLKNKPIINVPKNVPKNVEKT